VAPPSPSTGTWIGTSVDPWSGTVPLTWANVGIGVPRGAAEPATASTRARTSTMPAPGAVTSGLVRPSVVGPRLENAASGGPAGTVTISRPDYDDLVFTGSRRGALRNLNFRHDCFDAAAQAVGLTGLTPHELRRAAASLAVSACANVKAVHRMLGHASAAMTLDGYSGLFDDDLDEVAERLDADSRVAKVCPQAQIRDFENHAGTLQPSQYGASRWSRLRESNP